MSGLDRAETVVPFVVVFVAEWLGHEGAIVANVAILVA